MKKRIASYVCALAALTACGDYDDSHQDAPSADDAELGELEEGLTAASGGFGWSSSSANRGACNTTSTTQQCMVPFGSTGSTAKQLRYCIRSTSTGVGTSVSFTSGEQAVIVNAITSAASGSGWPVVNGLGTAAGCTLSIRPSASGVGAGSSTIDVSSYRSITPQTTVSLTESVPGTWSSFQVADCQIDMADVLSQSGDGVPSTINLLQQLAGGCAAAAIGIGTHSTNASAPTITDNKIIQGTTFAAGLSAREKCLTNSWNGNGPGAWAFSGVCN